MFKTNYENVYTSEYGETEVKYEIENNDGNENQNLIISFIDETTEFEEINIASYKDSQGVESILLRIIKKCDKK